MPKRVKMLTSKLHRKTENFFTHHFRSLKYIRFVENNCFSREQWGRGINFRLFSLLGAPGQFDWTKLAHCTFRSCILQNKTIIRPLRHILRKKNWTKSPLWGPGGPDWTKIAHVQLDHRANNMRT